MPIDIEKSQVFGHYGGRTPIGEEPMSDMKEKLLRDFELLSEEQKRLVVEYASSFATKAAEKDKAAKEGRVARRLAVLKEMDKLAIEIGKHCKEDIDAVALLSSMRR